MGYELIDNPPTSWLERVRKGHKVWLVKENQMAEIEFPYEPPEPGFITGRIGINRYNDNYYAGLQAWYIDSNGKGIDGSLLMKPIKDNLPENPAPLPDTVTRQILRAIEHLEQRIRELETDSGVRYVSI